MSKNDNHTLNVEDLPKHDQGYHTHSNYSNICANRIPDHVHITKLRDFLNNFMQTTHYHTMDPTELMINHIVMKYHPSLEFIDYLDIHTNDGKVHTFKDLNISID